MKIMTAEEMYEYEKGIMEEKGVPDVVLMESASRAVVRQMKKSLAKTDRVLVAAGTGNNGGDGIAVGRILHNEGLKVDVVVFGEPDSYSEQNRLQQKIAESYGLEVLRGLEELDFKNYSAIVDALFGIGLSREIDGPAEEAVKKINGQTTARVYAVDIPSGVSAVEGKALGTAVKADKTITFGFRKYGMEKEELKNHFGEITVDDIGFFY